VCDPLVCGGGKGCGNKRSEQGWTVLTCKTESAYHVKGPDAAVVLGSKALLTVSVQSTKKTADTADS